MEVRKGVGRDGKRSQRKDGSGSSDLSIAQSMSAFFKLFPVSPQEHQTMMEYQKSHFPPLSISSLNILVSLSLLSYLPAKLQPFLNIPLIIVALLMNILCLQSCEPKSEANQQVVPQLVLRLLCISSKRILQQQIYFEL